MTEVPESAAEAPAEPLLEPEPEPEPEPDRLEALGEEIGWPDAVAEDAARTALDDPGGALGRLGDLAAWWASVRGDGRAAPPSRVLLVGASPQVARRFTGRTLSFDVPPGGPEPGIGTGVAAADAAAADGVDLVVLCLDSPQSTRALAAELLGLDAVDATGWPQDVDLSDTEWMDQVGSLRDRLYRMRGLGMRPGDLAAELDPPVVATTAFLVRAVALRLPVLLDGAGAAAAALLARRAAYASTGWWQAAHRSPGRLSERMLASLNLTPLTDLGVRLEDGTGGLAGLAVLETAVALLTSSDPPGDVDGA